MLKVYVASKLWHWKKWLEWEDANVHDVKIISRWVNVMRHHETEEEIVRYTTPDYAHKGWQMNIEDVKDADLLVVYAENEDLRGALIEVGIALASGVPIILVGNSASYSEWTYHSLVQEHVEKLESVVPNLKALGIL